jgi:serine protease Do
MSAAAPPSSDHPTTDLPSLVRAAAERLAPSVVGLGRGWHAGSGVVVAKDRVLTVAHAVQREEVAVSFAGGRRAEARLLAIDADGDLAVLETETGDAPAVTLGDATHPGLGAAVVALADPGGRGLRATPGFVASGERRVRGPRGRRIEGAIEHTAPLPRGSSGGPLVDVGGTLLGLNAIREGGGLILAVPAARERVERLVRGEAADRVRLGVAIAPERAARRMRQAVGLPERDGLLVRGVRDESPAAAAGLERGDLLVKAGDADLAEIDDLHRVLDAQSARATLELTLVRGVDERKVEVTF